MQFKGRLLLPGDDGPGLSVSLDVAEHHLAVESDGGGLGAWPLEVVDVERLEGSQFALTVAGEPLRFVADDTIAFAYTGVPTIERVVSRPRTRSGLRSFLDKIWNAPSDPVIAPGQGRVSSPSPLGETPPVHVDSTPSSPQAGEFIDVAFETDEEIEGIWQTIPPVGAEPAEPPRVVDELSESRCPAVRGDGRQCESPILTSSGFCYPHDPKRAFDDKYRDAQDARAQIRKDATGRLNRIYGRLEKALRQVERGELDPETAMAMAQLARTMCAILDVDPPSPTTKNL